ncbi:hypothetical protein [Arthrobacter sp. AFG20]|uniref:hypothetical protein n=1 Tax=Arthrobacter sp. AFG20 TaxID=1688671 RepID=UPI000C9EB8B5|nr:hypothetical protein [Arthrobacter sp. AFG20]PNH86079.1 hypothetical protein CXZ05_02955 [Arthrobacter sp. AFG20]
MFKKIALAAVVVVAMGSLTACGSSENTVSSAGGSSAAAVETTAAPAAKTSGTFADTITFPSGVSVKVKPAVVTAGQYASGAVEGKIVTFDITVKNGSKEDLNAALMSVPKVTYGADGTAAQIASDFEAKIGGSVLSTVLPGETQTAKVGYGIPAASFKDVRVEIMAPSFSDKPAIFKGAVK